MRRIIRKRDERGSTLVEAAIGLLPLLLILFGLINYGLVFKDQLSLNNASRHGARVASSSSGRAAIWVDTLKATKQAGAGVTYANGDTMFFYLADEEGEPATGCPGTQCLTYKYNNGTWSPAGGTWAQNDYFACYQESRDSVGVKIKHQSKSVIGFFPDLKLQAKTYMLFEPRLTCEVTEGKKAKAPKKTIAP